MPLIIEEMSTTLEIQDESKIRKLVRQMIKEELLESKRAARTGSGGGADPADPAASGGPQESGGG
jgi:hypothetical protein